MPNILVYGWYSHGNIGDDLFVDAFKKLFPSYNFTFTNVITKKLLEETSAVFFGGGSFLYAKPAIADDALEILKTKNIFYISVGAETDIHPTHKLLIGLSKLVAIRSVDQVDKIKQLNENTIFIPDIVYSLTDINNSKKKPNSVLIISNISVVPKCNEDHWKHMAWEYFKFEFSQFLDYLIENKYDIKFFSMCQNIDMDDQWAAIEIINKMKYRRATYQLDHSAHDFNSITKVLSQYETIITQRYHGIVLAEILKTPYLAIHHHDKLRDACPNNGIFTSFFGTSKQNLIDKFNQTKELNLSNSIINNNFKELIYKVSTIIG